MKNKITPIKLELKGILENPDINNIIGINNADKLVERLNEVTDGYEQKDFAYKTIKEAAIDQWEKKDIPQGIKYILLTLYPNQYL